ncbi:hypothetical protein [Halostella sp. PRR32]|uniref:hypothetical protein n=1 Tax=Halostella sp. PRR32 TaxID=3098147 RepID=UPI002B1D75D0|nr:hypothetical protein [Halostella sp. PRR32]
MSPTFALDELSIPERPHRVFPALVESDCLCQQCYRRLKRTERYPDEAGRSHGDIAAWVEPRETDTLDHELLDRVWSEQVEIAERSPRAYVPDEPAASASTRSCWHCGALRPHRSPSTRDKDEADMAARGLSASLAELAVAHDRTTLIDEVARHKSNPALSGNDHTVFRLATAVSVYQARD